MLSSTGPSRSRERERIAASARSWTRHWRRGSKRAEAAEDRASADSALAEYRRDGGTAAAEFFGSLAAETQATYGSDEA